MDFGLENSPFVGCEPEELYNINRELNKAWELVEETSTNVFLTGRAGTGKTTFLRNLRASSAKRMVVLAPTGVAAINANGSTIHSFFQLPFAPFVPGKGFVGDGKKFFSINRQKKRLISSLSLLVIDEISMVRPDTLDAIDHTLRRLRNSSRPFGGVQLLLIGDLRQLPPVVRQDEWELIKDYYPTPYFFESHALKSAGYRTVELSVVYRQSDRYFLDILNKIRDGKATSETLSALNRRYLPNFQPDDNEGYIRLVTHNYQASSINRSKLDALSGHLYEYEADIKGEFPESSYPAEKTLELREGAQVMFIKNDTGANRRYYNGLIGTVTDLSEEKIIVTPHDGNPPIEVGKAEWENTRYAIDSSTDNVTQETIGTFSQFPLQLAWAITIHKSQGLTFDKAIIDSSRSFAPGQTYVALSRCRSLEGLVLGSPVPPQAIIVDKEVNHFIENCENNRLDEDRIEILKQEYVYRLLCELFDFTTIRNAFNEFSRYVREFIVPQYPQTDSEIREWEMIIDNKLVDIGRKFTASYSCEAVARQLSEENSPLASRIKNGCNYFIETLEELPQFLSSLPKDIDNSDYASRLNNTYDALKYLIDIKLSMLRYIAFSDFNIRTYHDAMAHATISTEQHESSNKKQFSKSVKSPTTKKKPKGYSTFETLRLWEEGKDIPQIAKERDLAVGTIVKHVIDLINLEKIKPEDVVDLNDMEKIRQLTEAHPEAMWNEIYELFNESRKENPLPSHLFNICYKLQFQKG